jgi:hypothetical protein
MELQEYRCAVIRSYFLEEQGAICFIDGEFTP